MNILPDIEKLLARAFEEDLGTDGDVTSSAVFPDGMGNAPAGMGDAAPTIPSEAFLLCKASGVFAGADAFAGAFEYLSPRARVEIARADGEHVSPGEKIASVSAPIGCILSAERTALNLVSYLSGIATTTAAFVAAAGRGAVDADRIPAILDTRKTLPGFRLAAKRAVVAGGGVNHRLGLYDMVLLKNNHVDACGGVAPAVRRVRERWGARFTIEVECRTEQEVRQALEMGVELVMLDNMTPEEAGSIIRAVRREHPTVRIECSGDMDLPRVEAFSRHGPDFISVGRLTHSVAALDFSLRIAR